MMASAALRAAGKEFAALYKAMEKEGGGATESSDESEEWDDRSEKKGRVSAVGLHQLWRQEQEALAEMRKLFTCAHTKNTWPGRGTSMPLESLGGNNKAVSLPKPRLPGDSSEGESAPAPTKKRKVAASPRKQRNVSKEKEESQAEPEAALPHSEIPPSAEDVVAAEGDEVTDGDDLTDGDDVTDGDDIVMSEAEDALEEDEASEQSHPTTRERKKNGATESQGVKASQEEKKGKESERSKRRDKTETRERGKGLTAAAGSRSRRLQESPASPLRAAASARTRQGSLTPSKRSAADRVREERRSASRSSSRRPSGTTGDVAAAAAGMTPSIDRSHACPVSGCDKVMGSSSTLNCHINTAHASEAKKHLPYGCEHCDYACGSLKTKDKHLKTAHNK